MSYLITLRAIKDNPNKGVRDAWTLNEIKLFFLNKHLLSISNMPEDCHYDVLCLHSTAGNTFTKAFNAFQNWFVKKGPK